MRVHKLHRWTLSYEQAVELQVRLARRVLLKGVPRKISTVAGADVSYDTEKNLLVAGIVVLDACTLELVERAYAVRRCRFPYIPGLLSFRECPALLAAARKIRRPPSVLVVDSQGIAHPRRFGLASHLGLWLDLATVGCAKSWLVGEYEEPGPQRGAWTPLRFQGRQVGAVVRTRNNVRPVFVSPGHRMSVRLAVRIVLQTGAGFRLPEPVRQAHLFVNKIRRSLKTRGARRRPK